MPSELDSKKAMQWQHTRCRIARTTIKDRYEGVTDIGHADRKVWAAWHDLGDFLHQNIVSSVCVFGTFHDGAAFTSVGIGGGNVHVLVGASVQMTKHLLESSEEIDFPAKAT